MQTVACSCAGVVATDLLQLALELAEGTFHRHDVVAGSHRAHAGRYKGQEKCQLWMSSFSLQGIFGFHTEEKQNTQTSIEDVPA